MPVLKYLYHVKLVNFILNFEYYKDKNVKILSRLGILEHHEV